MLEIEIKAYCDDTVTIVEKILSLGGNPQAELHERDIYFMHPLRDFSVTDEAFRIRIQNDKNLVTYKGPKLGERTKTRIEYETEFNDFDSMFNIIKSLGFQIAEETVKKRTVFKINDIEVCVDFVPDVGNFIELEKKGTDRKEAEKELFELAGKLGLTRFERKSYLELKLEKMSAGK
ncbi:MAG: class IV adenylate cyclase [Spirochaetes bacterium]|nr:class IV adenylate cyclase [Spirochaetota bacterium]